ncbi:MAG: type II secretion system secretin GspD [Methylobacteriaceae bacterium]|nr:type II secretion system secretin GspD [Methylobacteriaceae bacterium]
MSFRLRHVSRGQVSRGYVSRALVSTACIGWLTAILSACTPTPLDRTASEPPDAIDRLRAADLLPRFPRPPGPTESTGSGARAGMISYGEIVPVVAARGDSAGPGGDGAASAGDGFSLNFENAPIASVAKVVLGDILGVGYTIDPRAQGTVSLSSGRPVPKRDILLALESALRTSNLVLVKDPAGYRIVPVPEAAGTGGMDNAAVGPPEPGYGITVIPLQYVSVQTITKLIEGFATRPGMIRADPSNNLIIVAGNALERRSAVETVLSFDRDWMRGQSVGIFPVKNSAPEPMIAELEKILDSGDAGLSQSLVRFQPISRMNAILVVSRRPEVLRTAATWISRLDNSDASSAGVKVYRVRYGDAKQIARLLNDMFVGGSAQSALDSATNQLAPSSGATSLTPVDRLTGGAQLQTSMTMSTRSGGGGLGGGAPAIGVAATSGSGSSAGIGAAGGAPGTQDLSNAMNAAFGGPRAGVLTGVRITPDLVNNAVLIFASPENYRIIERAIVQLDRPQLQVAVELTIAEVTLNDSLNYGVQFFLQNKFGSLINSSTASLPQPSLPGFNAVLGNLLTPQVVINALHGYTDVKVLSNPSLVVVDNQVATLQVGDQVPVTTGTATVLTGQNSVVNTIDYKNTGIILRVQPRINSNGNVLMDVEQEISSIAQNGNQTSLTPTVSQRRVKSSIMVTSGQTVLLAGLVNETQGRNRSTIPLVDQIPLLGDASGSNGRNMNRTELIIFIRPQIIRDGVDASHVAEELRSKIRGSKIGNLEPPGAVAPFAPTIVK